MVDEAIIERFVAEERAEDEFRRGCGTTDIEAARLWKNMPESIRQLLLGNAFCPNCGVTSFASGYSLRMRDGFVLIEGRCAACGAEAKVPFQPREDRPVYCSECFAKQKEQEAY